MSEIAEVQSNEQEVETEGKDHRVEDEEQLDPALVEGGRQEERDNMVETPKLFDFGSREETTTKAGKKRGHDEVGRLREEGRRSRVRRRRIRSPRRCRSVSVLPSRAGLRKPKCRQKCRQSSEIHDEQSCKATERVNVREAPETEQEGSTRHVDWSILAHMSESRRAR